MKQVVINGGICYSNLPKNFKPDTNLHEPPIQSRHKKSAIY